jgi:hypothetical protein
MRLTVVLALLCASVAAAEAPYPTLSDADAKKLEAGEVVVRDFTPLNNHGIGVLSFGVIDAPTQEVFPLLQDCNSFATYMPSTKQSNFVQVDGVTLCHVELRLPFPLPNLWSDTTSDDREGPTGSFFRTWTQVRGTYNHNNGGFTALPWGEGGKKTLLVYSVDSDPKIFIPDALLRSAQAGSLPDLFAAIRKRVVTLRQQPQASRAPGN